jgi:CBS domain containing-hemolysin-like protein
MIAVVIVVVLLVAANSFYVAGEFSGVGARRSRIAHMAEGGDRIAARLQPVLEDPDRLDEFVAACQLGITASSLGLGFYGQHAIAGPLLAPWLAQHALMGEVAAFSAAVTLVLVSLTTLQVVFGEIVPKAIALRHPERVALVVAVPMLASIRLFRPLIAVFNGSASLVLRGIGSPTAGRHLHLHSPQEIEFLVAESSQAGRLDPVEREMLRNAFDLGDLVARQVMIPRNRLDMADVDTPVEQLLARLSDASGNRIPVYEETPDAVLGIVHIKDLLRLYLEGSGSLRDVVREVPFLPETVPINQLWQRLIAQGHPAVVILDEYGGTAGLVTQEEIIEEVMGEVMDEYDIKPERIVRRPGAPPLVRGDLLVEEVNDELDLRLPTDGADTVGGLVVDLLGRMPQPGDQVLADGTGLRVHSVRGHSVFRVAILHRNEGPGEGEAAP